LLSRTSFWSISVIRPSKSPCVGHPSLSRLKIRLYIATLVAIKHAIVHRNSRCVRTCLLVRFVAIKVLVRDHHRNQQMSSCNPHCTQLACLRAHDQHTCVQKLVALELRYSFVIMFVIARACPVHRNIRCDRTCNGLTDCTSTIKAMGQLVHSRAASFS